VDRAARARWAGGWCGRRRRRRAPLRGGLCYSARPAPAHLRLRSRSSRDRDRLRERRLLLRGERERERILPQGTSSAARSRLLLSLLVADRRVKNYWMRVFMLRARRGAWYSFGCFETKAIPARLWPVARRSWPQNGPSTKRGVGPSQPRRAAPLQLLQKAPALAAAAAWPPPPPAVFAQPPRPGTSGCRCRRAGCPT
jgi:hypothetical protein